MERSRDKDAPRSMISISDLSPEERQAVGGKILAAQMRRPKGPLVESASCKNGVLRLKLKGAALEGTTLSIKTRELKHLAPLSDEQLAKVQVASGGSALFWREANMDYSVAGLIELAVGLKERRRHHEEIAVLSAEALAQVRAAKKQKGGRPRKTSEPPRAK